MFTNEERLENEEKYRGDFNNIPAIIRINLNKKKQEELFDKYVKLRQCGILSNCMNRLFSYEFRNKNINKFNETGKVVWRITDNGLTYINEFSLFDIMKEVLNEDKINI